MKRKGRPALPKHIKKLLNKRKQLWIKMKKNATTENKQKFKEIEKQCGTAVITNEADRVKELIRNVDRSGFYRYVNKTMGRSRIPVLLKHKQTGEILNNKDCVEQFAKFFQSMYIDDNGTLLIVVKKYSEIFENICFDTETIANALRKTPSKYLCGPDGIPKVLLKKLSNVLSLPLSLIFQISYDSGIIPTTWKHANVVPIYEGAGSKYDENNNRPISLTSNISKIMEGIICEKIVDYCNRHSIKTSFQHGFRKSKSSFKPSRAFRRHYKILE